jgi:hypothetical protein
MWATLAFAVAVTAVPAQAGPLRLSNPRATYGLYGAARAENAVLPGDIYFLTFDIENLTTKDNGEVTYKMGLEFLNSKDKVVFGEDPQEKKARLALGGKSLPAFAAIDVGPSTTPGRYTARVTVVDPMTKKTEVLESKFEVLPPAFGVVLVSTIFPGRDGLPAPTVLVPGQSIVLSCSVVGFERAKTGDKQPSIGLQLQIRDDTGKVVSKLDDKVPAKDKVPEEYTAIPIQLPLDLNRTGKFTIELEVTDKINTTAKPVTVKLPLHVVEK